MNPTTLTIVELKQFEAMLIIRLRNLKPYEKIEIKLKDNKPGLFSIHVTSQHQEVWNALGKRIDSYDELSTIDS